MSDDHFAAKVGRQVISNNDFRYGFLLSGGDRVPPEDRQAGAPQRER